MKVNSTFLWIFLFHLLDTIKHPIFFFWCSSDISNTFLVFSVIKRKIESYDETYTKRRKSFYFVGDPLCFGPLESLQRSLIPSTLKWFKTVSYSIIWMQRQCHLLLAPPFSAILYIPLILYSKQWHHHRTSSYSMAILLFSIIV